MNKNKNIFGFVLLAFMCMPAAYSAPVTWTLQGVTFDDGGTLSGSFVYDAATNTYSDIAIVSSEFFGPQTTYTGSNLTYYDLCETVYGTNCSVGPMLDMPLSEESNISISLAAGRLGVGSIEQVELYLVFASALTDAGGAVTLDSCCPGELLFVEGSAYFAAREIVGGVVTAVPLPAAVWLFGSALAGLGWIRKKQTDWSKV